MASRKIDWELIERDFRAGILTFRELAEKHNVSTSTITFNVKKRGWTRDLTDAINQRTQQKIAEIDIRHIVEQAATETAQKATQTIQSAIEFASDVKASIVTKHRGIVKEGLDNAAIIEKKFNVIMQDATEIRDISTVTSAFKNLIDAKSRLIALERQSYGIDDTPDQKETFESWLKKERNG